MAPNDGRQLHVGLPDAEARPVHKLLERQLLRHFGSLEAVPPGLRPLLEAIDASYRDADEGHHLVERSLELASQELNAANAGLRAEVEMRRANEQQLKAILESAIDCVVLMDADGTVREFNPAASQTFGFTAAEAIGKPLADLIIPPRERERHRQGLARYLATGEGPVLNRRIEVHGMRRDGTLIPVELAIVPFASGGRTMFAGYLRDLSDRARAQSELARRAATVQLLQQVPLLAAEAATVEEAAKVCLDRICQHTGWPLGHAYFWQPLPDHSLGVLASRGVWHAEDPRHARFREVTQGMLMGWGIGLPGRVWKSGQPAWILDVTKDTNFPRAPAAREAGLRAGFAFPVLAQGKVVAVLEFFSGEAREPDADLLATVANLGIQLGGVFDRKRSEEQLKEAYERLQRVDRERTQFLNNAAHELGTPLTPIKLQVQLLRDRVLVGAEPPRKSVEILERNVERLGHLVKDLLDAARLQAGQLRLQPQPCEVGEMLAHAVEAYAGLAQANGIGLAMPPGPALRVHADPARLGQVFDNLLSNAIKFTPRGGSIAVRRAQEGDQVVVTVADTGIGLTREAMAKLFRPFSQVHDTMQQSRPGTGLGLYVSKGILEATGGTLSCASPGPGQGSTFTVRLPLLQPGRPTSSSAAPGS
jgi:PAS domain S-box-containing protein